MHTHILSGFTPPSSKKSNMSIQPLTPKDAEQMEAMVLEDFDWSIEPDQYRELMAQETGFKYVDDCGQMLGFVLFSPSDCFNKGKLEPILADQFYLSYLVVRKAHRGRGIGQQLLNLVLQYHQDVYTHLPVHSLNEIQWYEKRGFCPVSPCPAAYRTVDENNQVLASQDAILFKLIQTGSD